MVTSNKDERTKEREVDPYVGARPYTRSLDDQNRFFGRDDERDEIVSLILSHRLVLIYAASGAGKTSIFEAQIAPILEKYGFQVLPRARVGIASDKKSKSAKDNDATSRSVNFYMLNLFQSLAKITPEEIDDIYDKSLFEFLNIYFRFDQNGKIKPLVLVIDQLEELFTYYPGNTWRQQQQGFFQQIAEALEKNIELRVVLVIREDHLAQLDRFVDILPERLRPRFRLERLKKDAAFYAIKGPLARELDRINTNDRLDKKIDDKKIKQIVEDLSKIQDPRSDKNTEERGLLDGEFIEPIQLQVICKTRWKQLLLSLENTENNQAQVRNSIQVNNKLKWLRSMWSRLFPRVDNRDEVGAHQESEYLADVDNALMEFYEEEIHNAIKDTSVPEDAIRKLFEEKFVTSSGTRAFVYEGDFFQGLTARSGVRAFFESRAFRKKGDKLVDKHE